MGAEMEFHEVLTEIMKEKGINQAQLCKLSGIASSAMSHYVRGETDPSFTKVIAIAKALDVPIDILTGKQPSVAYSVVSFDSDEKAELNGIYDSLSPEGRKQLMVYARGCASTYPKNNEAVGA